MWIDRDIRPSIVANRDPIQVFRGPRQCGKTSLVLRLDPAFHEVSLDDTRLRELADADPELFLRQFDQAKLFIDEAQYAPRLFPALKRRVDLYRREENATPHTMVRLTGSNQILMDRHVKESLAGRASFFDMNTLTVAEILRARPTRIQDILYMGGWPELHAGPSDRSVSKYLNDYINSYIERDIVIAAGIQKQREFLTFARLLAGRTGQLVEVASLARDVGVDAKTTKDWVSILERMQIIAVLQPYSSSLTSRLTKAPKVHFLDTGIACRLQGWTAADPIITSPQQGHLFETLVYAELHKMIHNYQLGWIVYHWRSRGGEEIDFLVQLAPNRFVFIDAKVSAQQPRDITRFAEVRKVFRDAVPPLIHCHQEGERAFNGNVPIALLQEYLLKTAQAE